MADATPSVRLPGDAASGIVRGEPTPLRIGPRTFHWGRRTYVMGVINVTPDSFSGDGLARSGGAGGHGSGVALDAAGWLEATVAQARRMAAEGADLLDIGGESTRPGHVPVSAAEELARVAPAIRAVRAALPEMPLSVDTRKSEVAEAALEAGADLLNDTWGVGPSGADLARLAAERGVPLVVMHNRVEPRYVNVLAEVLADLQGGLERALELGVAWERLIVDPGMGFGKTAEQNLALLHELSTLRLLGRPVLLGLSRKSTIGRVLDLPVSERLEGTLATTALAAAAGVAIVRVHDVAANRRAARMADAIARHGALPEHEEEP
ncbi:MAG: dihydropteroate synthase [Candidatus Limnocylindrales bacterium]